MASPVDYPKRPRTVVAILMLYYFTLLPSNSVVLGVPNIDGDGHFNKQVLGSKPPSCVNKCFSCRPCMATLVIPTHQKSYTASSPQDPSENYYHLLWECRCGNNLFQP